MLGNIDKSKFLEDDIMSVDENMSQHSDEGQYSILRNEVRSTWPKRKPKHEYQKPKENFIHESQLTILTNRVDSGNQSPLNGSVSDIIYKDVDENIATLQDKLTTLTSKLEQVNADKQEKSNLYRRIYDENRSLTQKIKVLEQQNTSKEMELRLELDKIRKNLNLEFKKFTVAKNEEVENERNKVAKFEQELSSQRISRVARNNEVENTRYEIQRLRDKIRNNNHQIVVLKDELMRNREIFKRELQIEKKEHDNLEKKYQDKFELLQKQSSSTNQKTVQLSNQLEDLLRLSTKLRQENRRLCEEIEEVQAEILAKSVAEGKCLLQEQCINGAGSTNGCNGVMMGNEVSWATETDTHSKIELIEFIFREMDINRKMRQYSDKMIGRIIELDSSILEI